MAVHGHVAREKLDGYGMGMGKVEIGHAGHRHSACLNRDHSRNIADPADKARLEACHWSFLHGGWLSALLYPEATPELDDSSDEEDSLTGAASRISTVLHQKLHVCPPHHSRTDLRSLRAEAR